MNLLKEGKISDSNIRNIIFDWGGVITNIDYHATIHKFAEIGITDFKEYYSKSAINELFLLFEKGKIEAYEMRNNLRKDFNVNVTDQQIDDAWNAMLLDTPVERLELLKFLKTDYRIFLLSNTNSIHAPHYNKYIQDTYGINFPGLFESVYYSHEIGMRKPDHEIYEFVLNKSGLKKDETLFIDDLEVNILPARELGIQTYLLTKPDTLMDLFNS